MFTAAAGPARLSGQLRYVSKGPSMLRNVVLCVALLSSASLLRAAEPIQLFNGKDLTGWTYASKDESTKMADVWSVQDGVLHCKGKPVGYIRTDKDYTNFLLKVQWRVVQKGN